MTTNSVSAAREWEERDAETEFVQLEAWVREYLFVSIECVPDDPIWCDQWWRHPAAVRRLDALRQSWDDARDSRSAGAMSTWWVAHADRHLEALLISPLSPFRWCRGGHQEPRAPQRITEPPPGWALEQARQLLSGPDR